MNTIFLLILILISVGFISDLVLDLLNIKHIKPDLPEAITGRYQQEAYGRSQSYLKEKSRFGVLVSVLGFLALLVLFLGGTFAWLNNLVFSITSSPVWAALLFFGILGLAADIAGIPFELYSVFVIEEKYGFNKTTPGTFILDKLKSWLMAVVLGVPLLALIIWLYTLTGKWFWLSAWVIIASFSILMSFFYSSLIVPLFNRQEPLEDGELKVAIEEMSSRAGFRLDRIFVINGSKRSTKANAYFAGFGKKRRIVLYDTLIHDLDIPEILGVLAHEIGHYKKKHVVATMVLSVLQTGILLFLFSLVAGNPALSQALNISEPSFHISVLVFGILYSPVSMVTGLLFNVLSRKFEYQADAFASGMGYSRELGDALISLSEKNLSNLTPHPAYVFVHYSHPPLLDRLRNLIKVSIVIPVEAGTVKAGTFPH
jgi:STE24 endopeptidase